MLQDYIAYTNKIKKMITNHNLETQNQLKKKIFFELVLRFKSLVDFVCFMEFEK